MCRKKRLGQQIAERLTHFRDVLKKTGGRDMDKHFVIDEVTREESGEIKIKRYDRTEKGKK